MSAPTIESHFAARQQQISLPVRLYALVDGLLHAEVAGGSPERSAACVALFDGTPDASLADAGPWLIDHESAPASVRAALAAQATGPSGVSWIISAYSRGALLDHLRANLNVKLPDGRLALLRFYDARLMPAIAAMMEPMQRIEFFVIAFDWLVEINGKLMEARPRA
ncbi:DUF4123 domain-containing protein [Paraburkholderia tropica]|uniref:DUF4123 domain-containing protein n=1 Tax=Paraburkholderia tropica TaxID=92647 RepID=UPI002AAFF2E3|nr:DUF4123 domain-containing protein [Paraburkholderia tropica]